jgi:RNA polymerase sigma factor (sigma-70 family)
MKENLIQFPKPPSTELTPEQNLEIERGFCEVRNMASSLLHQTNFSKNTRYTLDDLISYGTRGLINAVKSYKPELEVPRKIYYRIKIKSAILDATRNPRTKSPIITINESSLNTEEGQSFFENLPTNETDMEFNLIKEQIQLHLNKTLEELNEKERQFIQLYFFENQTLALIAKDLGVNESRACQIKKNILEKLKKKLEIQGIHSAV